MAFLLGCPMPFGPVRPPAYPSHWLRQRAPPIHEDMGVYAARRAQGNPQYAWFLWSLFGAHLQFSVGGYPKIVLSRYMKKGIKQLDAYRLSVTLASGYRAASKVTSASVTSKEMSRMVMVMPDMDALRLSG